MVLSESVFNDQPEFSTADDLALSLKPSFLACRLAE